MSYLHLFVNDSFKEDEYKLQAFDLTPERLKSDFIAKWRWGREVFHDGRQWRAADVKQVRVVETAETSDATLRALREHKSKTADDLARSAIYVLSTPGPLDLAKFEKNVTSTYFPTGAVSRHPALVWLENRVLDRVIFTALGALLAAVLKGWLLPAPPASLADPLTIPAAPRIEAIDVQPPASQVTPPAPDSLSRKP